MRRTIKQPEASLFDYQDHVDRLASSKTALDQLNAFIDWDLFKNILDSVFKGSSDDKGGRPAFDSLFMLKVLVLQRMHNLSDVQTELAVMERMTWHRFLGVNVSCRFPDKNTIWDFRNALTKADAFSQCFDVFFEQIAAEGVELESGTMVDAAIVEVPKQNTSESEKEAIEDGRIPEGWDAPGNEAFLQQKDTEARWVKKRKQSYYGYKNHIKVDRQSKIIKDCLVTPANVHDSTVLFDLLNADDKRLYADSAYRSKGINEQLRKMGVKDWTCERAYRNAPLSEAQRKRNRTKSRVRVRVEHIFGHIVTRFDGMRQRYIGFERNAATIIFTNLLYNMDRLRFLAA